MGYLLKPRYVVLSTFKDEKDRESDTTENKGVGEGGRDVKQTLESGSQ
jgi:hypothetical protein